MCVGSERSPGRGFPAPQGDQGPGRLCPRWVSSPGARFQWLPPGGGKVLSPGRAPEMDLWELKPARPRPRPRPARLQQGQVPKPTCGVVGGVLSADRDAGAGGGARLHAHRVGGHYGLLTLLSLEGRWSGSLSGGEETRGPRTRTGVTEASGQQPGVGGHGRMTQSRGLISG